MLLRSVPRGRLTPSVKAGDRVRVVAHLPGPSPHMRDLRGREGTVAAVFDGAWLQLAVLLDDDAAPRGRRRGPVAVFCGEWEPALREDAVESTGGRPAPPGAREGSPR